jgi:hypothetical protein
MSLVFAFRADTEIVPILKKWLLRNKDLIDIVE